MALAPLRGDRRRAWPALLDAATDGLLVAFAAWTLFYQVALLFQFSVRWAAWPWLLGSLLLVAAFAWSGAPQARQYAEGESPAHRARPILLLVAAVLVAVVVLARSTLGMVPVALVGIVVLALQLWPWWRARARPREAQLAPRAAQPPAVEAPGDASPLSQWLAAAVSAGLAVLASFLLRPDADDVFYVNRATWIAERGVPVTHDTMFTPGRLPVPYNGGLPTPSIEALQGSLAHAVGLQAPTMAYLVFVPVMSFLAGWATWRLVRAWARRWHAAAYLLAVAFILASGSSIIGGYSIGRIWQGKVTAFAVLIPLIWLYLGRLAAHGRRYDIGMLFVAGICFVGLTTTSALLGPVIAVAAALAAAVLRSKALLLGAVALLAAPLANGVVEMFGPASVGSTDVTAPPTSQVFAIAFGSVDVLVVLGLLGLLLGPRLVTGRAGVVAAAASLAVVAIYLPGVLALVNAVTHAGDVVWRLGIEAPTAVLVGLLVTAPLDRSPFAQRSWSADRGLAAAIAVAVAVVLVVSGRWIWTAQAGGRLTSTPTWKVDPTALADVRAALQRGPRSGRWLLPPTQMQILAISSIGPFAVVPRAYYLPMLDVSPRALKDRRHLLALVSSGTPQRQAVAGAIRRLDVSRACVPAADGRAGASLRSAVGGAALHQVGDMSCWSRPAS